MAMLGIRLPRETARLLHGIEVPGQRTAVDEMHVTMLHLGDDLPISEITRAIEATYQVVASMTPFLLMTEWVSTFNPNSKGETPVIARVTSSELHELQASLRQAFDEANVEYSKKFPDFLPHVTLSYAPESMEDFAITPVRWAVGELTLWGGDEGDTKLSVTFPFDPPTKSPFAPALKTAFFLGA